MAKIEPAAKKQRVEAVQTADDTTSCLNDDCILKIFEYFELNELCAVARTCKKWKELVDQYVKQKCHKKLMTEVRIQSTMNRGIVLEPEDEYVSHFLLFMQNVTIGGSFHQRPLEVVEYMQKNCNRTLKTIAFQDIKFKQFHGELLVEWLSSLESVAFFKCTNLDRILKHCSNLKNLKIDQYSKDAENVWMDQTYPTLENLQFDTVPAISCEKLAQFLTQNPNVKSLTLKLDKVHGTFIRQCMSKLIYINLQTLLITFDKPRDFELVKDQLKVICGRSEFSRLELYFNRNTYLRTETVPVPFFNDLQKMTGLHVLDPGHQFRITSEHVKVLQLADVEQHFSTDVDLSVSFPNIEELYLTLLCDDFVAFVKPIVRHAVKLKKMVVSGVKIPNHTETTSARLAKYFNDVRERLPNACELIVYMDKYAYDQSTDPVMAKFRLVQIRKVNIQWRQVNFLNPFLVNFDF